MILCIDSLGSSFGRASEMQAVSGNRNLLNPVAVNKLNLLNPIAVNKLTNNHILTAEHEKKDKIPSRL